MRKNIIVIMALMVMLFQSGLTVKAADYKDKEFSFCCQQGTHITGTYKKGVKGYVYCYPKSGQSKISVQINGKGSVKKLNIGKRYALTNSLSAGDSIYLKLTSQSKDNTIDKGVWSPDCAGSYTVK